MNDIQVAKGIGWFTMGLAGAELFAPKWTAQQIGLSAKKNTIRALGARELAAGAGLLASRNPGPWLWARTAGDFIDLAFLGRGLRSSFSNKRVWFAIAAVAGVTLLDAFYARRFGV